MRGIGAFFPLPAMRGEGGVAQRRRVRGGAQSQTNLVGADRTVGSANDVVTIGGALPVARREGAVTSPA